MAKRKRKLFGNYPNPYRESKTRSEWEALRRKYAKRANQRILRLERAGMKVNEPVLEYLNQIDRRRFSEQWEFKGSLQQLKREIAALSGFLSAETSMVKGRKAIAKRTRNTLNKRYGVDLSPAEMEYLLSDFNDFKEAVNMNSDALLQAIGEVSGEIDNKEKIDKIIAELRGKKSAEEQAEAIYKSAYENRFEVTEADSEAEAKAKMKAKKKLIDKITKAIIK